MEVTGFCGDNCSACPRYTATKSGDDEKLKEAAEMWKKAGWRDANVSPREMICYGCASVKWCRYDSIRQCAAKKQISNCGQCADYPCEKITEVFKQTELYAKAGKGRLSESDYQRCQEAFFSKKDILDKIHQENFPDVND